MVYYLSAMLWSIFICAYNTRLHQIRARKSYISYDFHVKLAL